MSGKDSYLENIIDAVDRDRDNLLFSAPKDRTYALDELVRDPILRHAFELLINRGLLVFYCNPEELIRFETPAQTVEHPSGRQTSSNIAIPLTAMISLMRKAIKNKVSHKTIDTYLFGEVDHETLPPNGFDYQHWERQSREHGRRDELTLEVSDDEPKILNRFVEFYVTPWRF